VFQHHIDRLQLLADRETKWEEEHPEVLRGLGYTDAREALATAMNEMPYLDWRESVDGTSVCPHAQVAKAKRARFADDVVEQPVRHKHCFARSHWRYAAGRWCASGGEAWLDTSFWREVGFGTPEHEAALDKMWDLMESENEDEKEDEELYLKEIEEEGRLVLAWLESDEREGRVAGAFSTELRRAE
jgi:hypothetical protein